MGLNSLQLGYFVRTAEIGQITLAAESLDVAQPALSQAIARLECQLGLVLLERHARGVSLTPAGEVFFGKAIELLAAESDAASAARSLARYERGVLEIGFLGDAPLMIARRVLDDFIATNPGVTVLLRGLPFPTRPVTRWLADVDGVVCHLPLPADGLEIATLWQEPRTVVLHSRHPLARRARLSVADVLDEGFYGHHSAVDPLWAAFWTLDDHRGTAPARITNDRAGSLPELVAAICSGRALRALPASTATAVATLGSGLAAFPLHDALPASCALVWSKPTSNPLVERLAESFAARAGAAG
jgi:DNA-binding transcriptional LysR family regulator